MLNQHSLEEISKYELALPLTLRRWMAVELNGKNKLEDVTVEHILRCFNGRLLESDEYNGFKALYDRAGEELNSLQSSKANIDRSYPNRLGKERERLAERERVARENAALREREIKATGYKAAEELANREVLPDVAYTNESRRDIVRQHHTRVVNGINVADQVARKTAQDELKKELIKIDQARSDVENSPTAKREQTNYESAIIGAERSYQDAIRKLDGLFKLGTDALVRSTFS